MCGRILSRRKLISLFINSMNNGIKSSYALPWLVHCNGSPKSENGSNLSPRSPNFKQRSMNLANGEESTSVLLSAFDDEIGRGMRASNSMAKMDLLEKWIYILIWYTFSTCLTLRQIGKISGSIANEYSSFHIASNLKGDDSMFMRYNCEKLNFRDLGTEFAGISIGTGNRLILSYVQSKATAVLIFDIGSTEGPLGSYTVNNVQLCASFVLHNDSLCEAYSNCREPPVHIHTQFWSQGPIVKWSLIRDSIGLLQIGARVWARWKLELHKCGLINMSYGESTLLPDYGRVIDLANKVVDKYKLVFIKITGNNGPVLTTVGAPGGTASSIIGVSANVSPVMTVTTA